jgi:DNA polymerase I-like protein with 3'-5' exonuclease and polymerase domains
VITIWANEPPKKVLESLAPVLSGCPEMPVSVSSIYEVPEGTKVIMALGSPSLRRLQDEKLVPKNRTITSTRSQWIERNKIPLLVSWGSGIGNVNWGYHVDLLTDVSLALRYALTGYRRPIYGEYEYCPDFSGLCSAIEQRHHQTNAPVEVAGDLETIGLDPYRLPSVDHPGAYVVTAQFTHLVGRAWLVRNCNRAEEEARFQDPAFREQMEFLLNCPYIRLRGANFKFDLNWLWVRARLRSKAFCFDTTIVGSLLDENRSNSLDVHTKIYVPALGGYADEFNATVDKSRMDLVPAETLKPYAGGDVDADLQVATAEKAELLKDPALTRFYCTILHPASRAFEKIEQGGVLVDMDAMKELKSDLEVEQRRLIREACKVLGGRIVAKHMDSSKVGGINLGKASLLKDFMFSPMGLNLKPKQFCPKPDRDGNPVPSTAMDHLEMFLTVPEAKPFIELLDEYGQCTKTYNTYVVGFSQYIRSDGRFHPTYYLFVGNRDEGEGGAVTGRLSVHDPAFQTIPKRTKWAKRIRRCYPAPPGYVVVERDYSAGELRVVACIAQIHNMLEAFRLRQDLHSKTAAKFSGFTYESLLALEATDKDKFEKTRYLGKAGNFGLVFGMGVNGFMEYARLNYGVHLTHDDAEKFRDGFFEDYPELLDYHKAYKEFARKYGFVRSPLGRIRHLPLVRSSNQEVAAKAERMAVNSPVQSTLTDMLLWSIALEDQQGLSEVAPSFGACHDAGYNYCPEDKVDVWLPQALAVQENLPFETVDWHPQIQFVADAAIGPNMGDTKKWKRPQAMQTAA